MNSKLQGGKTLPVPDPGSLFDKEQQLLQSALLNQLNPESIARELGISTEEACQQLSVLLNELRLKFRLKPSVSYPDKS